MLQGQGHVISSDLAYLSLMKLLFREFWIRMKVCYILPPRRIWQINSKELIPFQSSAPVIIVNRKVDLNKATIIFRRSRHDLHNSSYHTEHHSITVKYHDLAYFAHEHICTCQDEDCDSSFDRYLSLIYVGSTCGPTKLQSRLYFKSSCGVLGKVFNQQ